MDENQIRIRRGHTCRVSATVYALVEERLRDRNLPSHAVSTNAIVQFVLEQQARMPDYLRFPIKFATWLLALSACKNHFGFWHCLSASQRQSQLHLWRTSRFGPFRDLIRLYESLVTLALESQIQSPQSLPVEIRLDQMQSASLPSYPHPAIAKRSNDKIHTEIAVVGSGPGGAVTAALLAESGREVSLIEEGSYRPLESCEPFSAQEMIQKYRCGGQTPAMGKPKVAYVEGRCVGGGSEINSGLYHRTPPEILEQWRKQYQVERLEESDLTSFFEANEQDLTVATIPGKTPAGSRKLHEGAIAKGWKSQEIPRWFAFDGGVDPEGVPTGHRQSMTRTFIPRFEKAGGRILSQTTVLKFRRVNDRWEIQAIGPNGKRLNIESSSLFVACGATQTPALLQRSGFGSKPGSTLFLHPTVKITTRFADDINHEIPAVGVHQVKHFSPRLSFGCSIGSKPYLALGLLDSRHYPSHLDQNWRQMAIYYAMITGSGHGSVRQLPGFHDPLVRYSLSHEDLSDLADGLRKLGEILFESGAVELQPSISGFPAIHSRDELSRIPKFLPRNLTNLMTIHLFGSCPMGEDRKRCVTNSFGAVHGTSGLFLADASLLCTAPGVNPQGSIMAIVRRNTMEWLDRNR